MVNCTQIEDVFEETFEQLYDNIYDQAFVFVDVDEDDIGNYDENTIFVDEPYLDLPGIGFEDEPGQA